MGLRAFIAIDIPTTIELNNILDRLRESKLNLKCVESYNLHLTLKFLGDIHEHQVDPIADAIQYCVKDTKKFKLTLMDIGVFPNMRRPRVIWTAVYDDTNVLSGIVKCLEHQLETQVKLMLEKTTVFKPHVTLARIKKSVDLSILNQILAEYKEYKFCEFTVDSIKLKQSILSPKGPSYYTLHQIPLLDLEVKK